MAGTMSLSDLLRNVTPKNHDTKLYHHLVDIYTKLKADEDPGIITPDTVAILLELMNDDRRHRSVRCMVCYVLSVLLYRFTLAKIFKSRYDIVVILHNLLSKWRDHNGPLDDDEMGLFKAQLAVLESLSAHSQELLSNFKAVDMVRLVCSLCATHCKATFGYPSYSYRCFEKLTARIFPGLVGALEPVHEDLRCEMYTEYFGDDAAGQMDLLKEVFSVRLCDTRGGRDPVNIATGMLAAKAAWPLMENVVPSMYQTNNLGDRGGAPQAAVCNGDSVRNGAVTSQSASKCHGKDPDEGNVANCEQARAERPGLSSDSIMRRDVYVTSIVDGCRFWAQLGGKAGFLAVKNISQVLDTWPYKCRLRKPPCPGMLLAVRDPAIGYFRGQVVAVQENVVEIHALDYGFRKECFWTEEHVFEIGPELTTANQSPHAFLCVLNDISPPPVSVPVIRSLTSILRNFTVAGEDLYDQLSRPETIRTLHYLCTCPEPQVTLPAAQALSNLARDERLHAKLVFFSTLEVLLGVLGKYSHVLHDKAVAHSTYATLGAITNMIFNHGGCKNEFYTRKGLQRVLYILSMPELHQQTKKAACRLLATFLGRAVPTVVMEQIHSQQKFEISHEALLYLKQGIAALGMTENRRRPRGQSNFTMPATATQNKSDGISSSNSRPLPEPQSSPPRRQDGNISCSEQKKTGALSAEQLSEVEDDPNKSDDVLISLVGSKSACNLAALSGGELSDTEVLAPAANGIEEKAVVGIKTTDIYHQLKRSSHYVKGETVDFRNDLQHDLRPFENVRRISKNQMKAAICGILNTHKGGSIYIGIQNSGCVTGIVINRDQRDMLRCAIDGIMFQMIPNVPCSGFSINFHQVMQRSTTTGTYSRVLDLFVIELSIRGNDEPVYSLSDGSVHVREGGRTLEIGLQELHVRTVEEAEKGKLKEIETLERKIATLYECYD